MKSRMSNLDDETRLASPCISVCQIDAASGHCIGCYRTTSEIAAWGGMSASAQREVLEALRARRQEATGMVRRRTRRSRGARDVQGAQESQGRSTQRAPRV